MAYTGSGKPIQRPFCSANSPFAFSLTGTKNTLFFYVPSASHKYSLILNQGSKILPAGCILEKTYASEIPRLGNMAITRR